MRCTPWASPAAWDAHVPAGCPRNPRTNGMLTTCQRDVDRLATVAVTEGFIAGLPKAELHVHHVGSVSQRVVAELAARHPGTVPSDPDELARFFIFKDFP